MCFQKDSLIDKYFTTPKKTSDLTSFYHSMDDWFFLWFFLWFLPIYGCSYGFFHPCSSTFYGFSMSIPIVFLSFLDAMPTSSERQVRQRPSSLGFVQMASAEAVRKVRHNRWHGCSGNIWQIIYIYIHIIYIYT